MVVVVVVVVVVVISDYKKYTNSACTFNLHNTAPSHQTTTYNTNTVRQAEV